MTSWYSNLLTKTSSQISSLQSRLLSSESDGDTEDDTHVARVLRNYYSEKGRPFPPWLPPDPKAPTQAPIQPLYAQGSGQQRLAPPGQQPQAGGGGLSSLWDGGGGGQQQQVPQSLRAGRGMGAREVARPVAGDRQGSYQSVSSQPASGGAGGGSSAQDRLRQRLMGGARSNSPGQGGAPYQPPAGAGQYDGRAGGGMSATSPWSNGADEDFGGGGRAPPGGGRRGPGLPSGPRAYR